MREIIGRSAYLLCDLTFFLCGRECMMEQENRMAEENLEERENRAQLSPP